MVISARSCRPTAAIVKRYWASLRRRASTLTTWLRSSRTTAPRRSLIHGPSLWEESLPRAQSLRKPPEHIKKPVNVLVVDIGGTHVKVLATGQKQHREFPSGPKLTTRQMVAGVKKVANGWKYDAVSIGYPGVVINNRP